MNSTSMEEIAAEPVTVAKKKMIELPTAEQQEEIKSELAAMGDDELRSLISSFNATYLKYMAKEIGELLSIKNYSGISKDDLKKGVLERIPLLEMLNIPLRDLNSIILSVFLLKKERGSIDKPKAKSKVNTFINSIRAMNMPANMKEMMIKQAMNTFAKEEKPAATRKVKPPVEETGMAVPAEPVAKPIVRKSITKKMVVANDSLTEEEQRYYNEVSHLSDIPEDVKIAYAKVNRTKVKNPIIAKHEGSYIITSMRKAAELKVKPSDFIYPTTEQMKLKNIRGFGVYSKSLGVAAPPGGGIGAPQDEEEKEVPIPDIVPVNLPVRRRLPSRAPVHKGPKGMEGGKRKTRRNRKYRSKTHKRYK